MMHPVSPSPLPLCAATKKTGRARPNASRSVRASLELGGRGLDTTVILLVPSALLLLRVVVCWSSLAERDRDDRGGMACSGGHLLLIATETA